MNRRHKRSLRRMKKRIRKLADYRIWMNFVLRADDRRCVMCGKNKNLQVHHINRFSEIIMKYNITTINKAFRCKELWDVSNGLTLCQGCHKELHNNKYFEQMILIHIGRNK